MVKFALECMTTLLCAVLFVFFLSARYQLRKERRVLRFVLAAAVVAGKMLVGYLRIPPLNFISFCLMMLLLLWILYERPYPLLVLNLGAFVAATMTADTFGVLLVSALRRVTIVTVLSEDAMYFQDHVWNWIIVIVLVRLLSVLLGRSEGKSIRWHEGVFYVLLILFQVAIFAYISTSIQEYSRGSFLMLLMGGYLLLDIYIIFVFYQISHAREAERQVELMEQQGQIQLQMYRELQKKYDQSCSIMHDINRHLNMLEQQTKGREDDRTRQYFADMHKAVGQLSPMIKNQNAMLEIILNILAEHSQKESILLDMDVEERSLHFISDMDLTTIFSNLLDNAVEACMKLPPEQRWIQLKLEQRMGLIRVRIQNSCLSEEEERKLPRDATARSHIGIGLSNVKMTVKKYDGTAEIHRGLERFDVLLIIPVPNSD